MATLLCVRWSEAVLPHLDSNQEPLWICCRQCLWPAMEAGSGREVVPSISRVVDDYVSPARAVGLVLGELSGGGVNGGLVCVAAERERPEGGEFPLRTVGWEKSLHVTMVGRMSIVVWSGQQPASPQLQPSTWIRDCLSPRPVT